ncbi:hypothetical protein N7466_002900 [Penicillium verhagenii]|uniref:uncharacterized protein n=1 Tax=Penicillium verhagenii TaxID=1562060 RepID=UPI0025454140|nr:uncharacterized protein N7466_002900 [Penicillium verhagenii]KAJ5939766.1 hypothetical protein N7466_002900 [Penicillium verhagenii]
MDIVYHAGVNGSDPYVDFYPYTPSATAGYAFMGIFGITTLAHIILTIPYRAAYFIPLILGGETFGYYGRARSHQSRTDIGSWALQEILILCAPPLISATIYMVLGRIIRSFNAEHLSPMRPGVLTFVFVLNDMFCFCTQLGGAGVQVTGDQNIMDIGKKVVLAGLIFSLVVFVFFVLIAVAFHRRLSKTPPTRFLALEEDLGWRRYMWGIYGACFAIMLRNLVRTVQFGAGSMAAVNTSEVYIYVFDAFMMFFSMLLLVFLHPGLLIKKARRFGKVDFERIGTPRMGGENVALSRCKDEQGYELTCGTRGKGLV